MFLFMRRVFRCFAPHCQPRLHRATLQLTRGAMTFLRNPRIVALAKFGFWLALIFALVMAVLPSPPHTPIDRFGDKFAHMLAFATLAGLAMTGFGPEQRWRIVERLSFIGAMIEVVQSVPALHRDCDVRDWVADTVVVLIVVGLMTLLIPRRPAEPA